MRPDPNVDAIRQNYKILAATAVRHEVENEGVHEGLFAAT